MFKVFRNSGKLSVNVKVKESWEIEGPVGFGPDGAGPYRVFQVGSRREAMVPARKVWKKERRFIFQVWREETGVAS